jgi:hypothetical protein
MGLVISYYKKISTKYTDNKSYKEAEYYKKKMENVVIIKKQVDFMFIFSFAILIFILFRPGDKKGIIIDTKTNILLKISAITLLINLDWDSFYLFIHPHVKTIDKF